MRFKYDLGEFDVRDFQQATPLSFEVLASKFLEIKRDEVASFRHIQNHIGKAIAYWGTTNVKEIRYGELEDFLLAKTSRAKDILRNQKTGQPLSQKSRANLKATLHHFFVWLRKRQVLHASQIPEFPEVPFELGWRNIVDKETQLRILDEVYQLSKPVNLKIWIGIRFLCTYISIRPRELLNILEGDLNLDLKVVVIRKPKEGKPKTVPLLDEDIDLIRSLPRGLPHLHFFRHNAGLKGVKGGEPFGGSLLFRYWKKARKNLGVEGVDLYGGTKHSSATALRKHRSPEQIKKATMHSSNQAFERYFRVELDDLRDIYSDTRRTPEKVSPKRGELIEFTKK